MPVKYFCRLLPFILALMLLSGGTALAAQATEAARLDAVLQERAALAKDSRRSGLREGWEKIAEKLEDMALKAPKGNFAASCRFESAKTWEELSSRSHALRDYRKAAEAYATMERIYRGQALGAEALARQASLQMDKLKEPAEAAKTLELFFKYYPRSSLRKEAEVLQKSLKAGAASSAPAPSSPNRGSAERNAVPSAQPDPKAAAARYASAAAAWRALLIDAKAASQRDKWLELEERFLEALAKDPQGATAPKARFQAARCREELALRSFAEKDWRGAVSHYERLAKEFPRNNLADDSLYRAAFIQARRLNEAPAARRNAETILALYPKGDMIANARDLLKSLGSGASSAPELPLVAGRAEQVPRLKAIRWRTEGKGTTVVLELEEPASFRHRYVSPTAKNSSAMLQVDISGILPGSDIRPSLKTGQGVVRRIRTSHLSRESSRVLFDLAGARQYKVSTLDSPPRIIVRVSAAKDIPGGIAIEAGKQAGTVRQGEFGPQKSPAGSESLVEQLGLTVRTIMVDAGHGGKDPGAMGAGIKESLVTLKMAKMLGGALRKRGFTVLYTRETDKQVPLEERALMGNDRKADLFISLHVNANNNAAVNGLETYFLDLARTSSAAHVAARENAVSVKSISDLQFILTDLMLSSKLQESRELAGFVHKAAMTRLRKAGFESRDNGVRSAPFYVLMGARMPAVLVEIGYLSNPNDAKRIKNDKYLERLAEGIAEGVASYKKKLDRFAP